MLQESFMGSYSLQIMAIFSCLSEQSSSKQLTSLTVFTALPLILSSTHCTVMTITRREQCPRSCQSQWGTYLFIQQPFMKHLFTQCLLWVLAYMSEHSRQRSLPSWSFLSRGKEWCRKPSLFFSFSLQHPSFLKHFLPVWPWARYTSNVSIPSLLEVVERTWPAVDVPPIIPTAGAMPRMRPWERNCWDHLYRWWNPIKSSV